MNRAERMAATEKHPGVRRLKRAVPCEGWMYGTRADRAAGGRHCKNPAFWHFTPLKRKRSPGWTEPQHLCWSHLLHQGLYGDMDEYARTERWVKRMDAS